jgi:tRNA(fMet)-specific endonuclease VapC
METVVLDTDVVSFIAKHDSRTARYTPYLTDTRLCVCFQTIAELYLRAITRNRGASRRQALDSVLERFVVLPYDSMIASHWAAVTAHRRQIGQAMDCGDAWIAASALRHDATLLTHNGKHYSNISNLRLISQGS